MQGQRPATENFDTREVESMGRHLSMERLVTVKKQSSSHHHGCEFLLKSAVPLAAQRGIDGSALGSSISFNPEVTHYVWSSAYSNILHNYIT